jgi:hypothetical protein
MPGPTGTGQVAPPTGSGVEATLLGSIAHRIVDLGDDQYTRGRPQPMIDPSQLEAMLREAGEARDVGVLLLDLVLGRAAHADPGPPARRGHSCVETLLARPLRVINLGLEILAREVEAAGVEVVHVGSAPRACLAGFSA